METSRKDIAKIAGLTLAIIVVLGGIGTGLYYLLNRDKASLSTNDNQAEVANMPATQPVTNQNSNQTTGNQGVLGVQTPPVTDPGAPANPAPTSQPNQQPVRGSEVSAPASSPAPSPTTPTPPANKRYTNQQLQFIIEVPSNWTIESSGREVVVKTPARARYSIQMYPVQGDREQLRAFLNRQTNFRNVTDGAFAGRQAFAFDIDGFYLSGYAILDNNRLYYILGSNVENTPLAQSFKVL